MVTVDPDALVDHARHVHFLAEQIDTAKGHAESSGTSTQLAGGALGFWLGIPGAVIGHPMALRVSGFNRTLEALSGSAEEVASLIDATAERWRFVEEANESLSRENTIALDDVDNFHVPGSVADFPDAGRFYSIGSFIESIPTYREAGNMAVVLGGAATAIDFLGFYCNPVSGVTGELAGIIIDLCVPLKEVIDALLGDPGAISQASVVYEQMGSYLAEAATTFDGSLDQVTPDVWSEPGASDQYLKAAAKLIEQVVAAGGESVEVAADLILLASICADTRSIVVGLVVGWVIRAVIEASVAAAAAVPTAGASIPAGIAIMEADAWTTAAQVGAKLVALGLRLAAAAMVAESKADAYDRLTADLTQ